MKLDEQTVQRCPRFKEGVLQLKGQQLISINVIPDAMNAADLKELYVQNNLLKQLGEVAKYCWGIKKLSASVNFLSLFSELTQFTEIIHLDLSTNRFSEIGDMSNMTNLRYFNIEHNNTSFILRLPKNLQVFKAGWNNLSNLNFITSERLTQLHVSNNKIKSISRLANKCFNLKVMDLSYNMISKDQFKVLDVLLKNQLKNLNVVSFEGNDLATVKNFALEVLKHCQPDRINSNLITPFLKNTFRNINNENNLDNFLSLVQTDYGVNIKKEYEKKSDQIRSLNYGKQNNSFDDFKQLNKQKVVNFIEQMGRNNNRKNDNEMINLYKQMKLINKQQEQRERIVREKSQERKRREKEKEREREQERNNNKKDQSSNRIITGPSIQNIIAKSQKSTKKAQLKDKLKSKKQNSQITEQSDSNQSKSQSQSDSQSQSQSQSQSESNSSSQSQSQSYQSQVSSSVSSVPLKKTTYSKPLNKKSTKNLPSNKANQNKSKADMMKKNKQQTVSSFTQSSKVSESQSQSQQSQRPPPTSRFNKTNKTLQSNKTQPKPDKSQANKKPQLKQATKKQIKQSPRSKNKTNKRLADTPSSTISKRKQRLQKNHNNEIDSQFSASNLDESVDRQFALDEEDNTGMYDPRIWQYLIKHYEYY